MNAPPSIPHSPNAGAVSRDALLAIVMFTVVALAGAIWWSNDGDGGAEEPPPAEAPETHEATVPRRTAARREAAPAPKVATPEKAAEQPVAVQVSEIAGTWVLDVDATARMLVKDVLEEAAADPETGEDALRATRASLDRTITRLVLSEDGTFRFEWEQPAILERFLTGTWRLESRMVTLDIALENGVEPAEPSHKTLNFEGDRLLLEESATSGLVLQRRR